MSPASPTSPPPSKSASPAPAPTVPPLGTRAAPGTHGATGAATRGSAPPTPAPGPPAHGPVRPETSPTPPLPEPGGKPPAPSPPSLPTPAGKTAPTPEPGLPTPHGETAQPPGSGPGDPLRLTWVQPEDLVGHEFRQAAEDGRGQAAEPLLRVWLAAGGHLAPTRAGASPTPAPPELRALATDLLTALAALPTPAEPPPWPDPPGHGAAQAPGSGDLPPASGRGGVGEPSPTPDTTPAGVAGGHATATHDPVLRRRLEAAWLGRAVGCVLGKPVEKLPLHGIRALARAAGNWPLADWFTERGVPPEVLAAHPWNRRSAPTSLAENIDGAPEDDDLNYPLLGLLLLQRHGKGFTTADVGRLWLDELPAGRTFTAERVAYRNLLQGLEPPATATHHNPFREWIGALIRADVHGWTNPGAPAAAAAQAYRDAALTHTGNGAHAATFVAAATATAATGQADVHTALRAGLAAVPPRSRLAEAVRFGIRTASDARDTAAGFDTVVDLLHARYGHYHWVHAVPNTAVIAAALTHADGDFTHSVCRAVSGGWDTDSNGATAGALAGLIAGSPDAIPHRWTAPLKNRLATTVPGFDGIGFDTLAHLTAQEAARS
ncbi:ADP-ribosylglycohydrolase family protein [Streptomyces sp. AP-93]|uniref:ADP-ribosylglycohydrolase family protein n=1 Tax=Streptomyces sp. AP-93 TaxID=2929048 RepID=UPI001FB006D2|nr:ADP-ribosylglycohydrolase family protein [Streptomyces sp. AP-93]MCJ0868319.1 ADP-ribosylglycohydrolase family protein [Streptomyces sp. AP-93]